MSHDDRFIGQLEDYLDAFDAVTPLPDRVRDAVRAELPSARQVRPWPGVLRLPIMLSNASAGARLGLATAAIVAAVVLGAAFLNNDRSAIPVGRGPTPTPTATITPSPSPSVAAQPRELGSASNVPCDAADVQASTCIAPGTYQLTGLDAGILWPVTVTLDVPAGWFEWFASPGAEAVLVDGGPEARGDSGWGVLFATVGDVSRDPCDQTKGLIPASQVDTPQKLAAAMAAWPGFTAAAPQPITVDGHSGLKLQLTSTDPSTCYHTGSLWRTTSDGTMNVYPMISSAGAGAPGTFEIVDTGHGLLVIRTTDFPQTSPNEIAAGVAMDPTRHAAHQTALHAILDSIRLTAVPTP